jgi:hypothetical protein
LHYFLLHTCTHIPCTLSSLSPFIGERRALAATHVQPNKCQPTTTIKKSWWLEKGWQICYRYFVIWFCGNC